MIRQKQKVFSLSKFPITEAAATTTATKKNFESLDSSAKNYSKAQSSTMPNDELLHGKKD
jgi:hypothetical protein